MYPDLFTIGPFTVTSFGVLVGLGALLGLWIFARELHRSGLPATALDAALAGVLAGLAGAKLLYVMEHLGEAPFAALIFARGGLSWYGGLVGGVGAGIGAILWRRLPLLAVISAATPGLAIGQAVGRVGCFLVGDDYGRPTGVPWAVAFPNGLPPTLDRVHPTQLYETAVLLPLACGLILLRRRGAPDRVVVGAYLFGAGLIRFAIEWLRVDVRVALGMSVAHWASLGTMVIGAWLAITRPEHTGRIEEVP